MGVLTLGVWYNVYSCFGWFAWYLGSLVLIGLVLCDFVIGLVVCGIGLLVFVV